MAPHSPEILRDRERALEDEFFRREDQRLLEHLTALRVAASTREALAKASGITDPVLLDMLVAHGIKAETVAALSFVPLLEVAWADGRLDAKERSAVLARAHESGVEPGSFAHGLLEAWLDRRPEPSLLTAWTQFVHGLRDRLSATETAAMKTALIERARSVATASGGLFSKISSEEAAALDRLEHAFTGS
jgi:hypothetical protein